MGVTTFKAKSPKASVKKPIPATTTTQTWKGAESMVWRAHLRRFETCSLVSTRGYQTEEYLTTRETYRNTFITSGQICNPQAVAPHWAVEPVGEAHADKRSSKRR